jgi:hypothetical protein
MAIIAEANWSVAHPPLWLPVVNKFSHPHPASWYTEHFVRQSVQVAPAITGDQFAIFLKGVVSFKAVTIVAIVIAITWAAKSCRHLPRSPARTVGSLGRRLFALVNVAIANATATATE